MLKTMTRAGALSLILVAPVALAASPEPQAPAAAEKPAAAPLTVANVKAPQPTVPEIFTLEGEFVRTAYNNEGYVVLGFRVANASLGEEWMLLEAGLTLRSGVKYETLYRDAFSLKTPDGKTIPLATQKEYGNAGYLPQLTKRAKVQKDSIAYFPVGVNRPCAFRFFADLGNGPNNVSLDQVDLADNRACVGRLFFKVPGGIKHGQHWLVVKFKGSEVQVPFRVMTDEEEKFLRKNWEELKKGLDQALEQ
jgi:hypothetical protein